MPPEQDLLVVAKIGKTVGLQGGLRLHIVSDFPTSFCAKNTYYTVLNGSVQRLVLASFDTKSSVAKFMDFTDIDSAKKLTNLLLYATKEDSYKTCYLNENEFFWFEVVGAKVIEAEEVLGVVAEVQRYGEEDFLLIKTDGGLLEHSPELPKSFLIPYNDRYILHTSPCFERRCGVINVCRSREILENS